ncbi:MAG: methyl-accepting chemotaxis protein [Steroidobacteraceae bacterium]
MNADPRAENRTRPRAEAGAAQARVVRNIPLLLAAAAILVVIATAGFLLAPGRGASGAAEPLLAVQELVASAAPARAGDAAALDRLAKAGTRLRGLAAAAPEASWSADPSLGRLLAASDAVVGARSPLADAGQAVRDAREIGPRLVGGLAEVVTAMAGGAADPMPRVFERFELRAQRLQSDLAALASGSGEPQAAARRLAEGADYMGQVINGLAGTDARLALPRPPANADVQSKVASLARDQAALEGAVRRAVGAAPSLPAAMRAADSIPALAGAVSGAAAKAGAGGGAPWWPLLPAVLALVPLALLFRQAGELRGEAERQRVAAQAHSKDAERNQEAILRLLDELSSLADGDLTVQATVTEDMTGAIADSINYAVEALRGLVATINGSAIQLDGAARQTTALAAHLAKASGAQSKQIGSATESIAEMAAFTEEVSGNAERAADVARHSVDVAHKGGDAVRRTIDGMNTIRETIQDTSKRIKRLGESSQEIGNIVELINDIAEQTNILALNASIQASMAGEAGRGFAVVADEVQRLAERAANATKQIEVLVRTIQADTNEAVVSMERSTTDVVGGALLAENAGAALEEIENVSNQIASLVQNISGSSRQQAQAAQNITRNMQVLKEISTQTAESTTATSQAVGKLAELSTELRTSVSGFRLPGATAAASSPAAAAPRRAAASAAPGAAAPAPAPVSNVGGAAAV